VGLATTQSVRQIASALAVAAATLIGATLAIETLLWAAPGDPIDLLPNGAQLRPVLEAEWGLHNSLVERWWDAVARLFQGDLGVSMSVRPGVPVWTLIAAPAGRSFYWVALAMITSISMGLVSTSITSAPFRRLSKSLAIASIAPLFLLAHLSINIINDITYSAISHAYIDRPAFFALPIEDSLVRTTLAIFLLAFASGNLSGWSDEIAAIKHRIDTSDYVLATRSRGLPVWQHYLFNAIPPFTSVIVGRLPLYLGGLVILERLFLLEGAGSLLWNAALLRDYPLAAGLTLLFAGSVTLTRLVVSLIQMRINPRHHLSRATNG
jgi:peptide/nickel transport system permease protein